MKKIAPLFATTAILWLASSCSVYQINTISSTNTPQNEKTGDFVMENDSVKITYDFAGQNAPISIQIQNKLDQPLYLDWQRSALVYNDSAISYAGNDAIINANVSGAQYKYSNRWTVSGSNISGSVALPQFIEFIPPHAFIKKIPLLLTSVPFINIADSVFRDTVLLGREYPARAKKASFSFDNSPLVFSSYLTFFTGESERHNVSYQQQFYISEMITTKINPEATVFSENQKTNLFYVSFQGGNTYASPQTNRRAIRMTGTAPSEAILNINNNSNTSK